MSQYGAGWIKAEYQSKDEWLTPPYIISALGEFDLDPCAPVKRPWATAKTHYTIKDNGLNKTWHGRVWLNPPFGKDIYTWLEKLYYHNNGIALIPVRCETDGFFRYVWDGSDGVLFFKGRLSFYHSSGAIANGSFGAPCCLVAYGANNFEDIRNSGLSGKLVPLHNLTMPINANCYQPGLPELEEPTE